MPIVIRNNTNNIEIDVSINHKITVTKGGYDVIYEDIGDGVPMVYIIFRASTIIDSKIKLDWRDCSSPDATFTSAENLRDTLTSWNIQIVNVEQKVTADSGNSSTDNLTAANLYSFTGTGKSMLGVAGIQVSLFTDQNCTVYIQQSHDNENWDLSDQYNYFANENFGVTVQAISSYVRVIVTAKVSIATTKFRLQTCLCPIVEAVPRTLDEYGNFKTGIKSIQDLYGFEVKNTPIGEMRVVTPMRLVGANFEGTTLDSNFWSNTVANNGTITQANAQVTIATNTTSANGSAKLYSVRRGRYVSGSAMMFRAVCKVTAGATNNKRRWGVAYGATMPTISDGAYFELDGSVFSVVLNKGGSEDRVSSGSFNGKMGTTYEHTLITAKTYEIYWTNSKVYFVINGELLHTFTASTDTWADTMNFHIYMDSVNSNNAQTNNVIYCRVASIKRLGSLITQPISKYQSGTVTALVCKYGAGNLHELIISAIVNNSAITLYDNTTNSGTVIWASGAMGATTQPYTIDFKGLPFYNGLTINIATANCNVVAIYE